MPSRSRGSTLELCNREYVHERQIRLESRRLRTKTDSRLRGDAGDPVARPVMNSRRLSCLSSHSSWVCAESCTGAAVRTIRGVAVTAHTAANERSNNCTAQGTRLAPRASTLAAHATSPSHAVPAL